ncbi:ABC transporter permease [Spiroplasma eriocheiris]|uniref:ABC transporter permease n=1 Tax=Spiroplasma eriocheiris TaxID=315358 RepID=UPI00064999AE|nr:ABC transporter permease [Spiroplasma eriocheiris]AHF58058.1 putative ABC-type transport system permease protein [Spiroplasma eriocheiris CCTCC M 207170]
MIINRTNNNQTYSYLFESEFGTSLDSLSDPRNFASYQVGNLYAYDSSAKFFRIIDLFNTYSQILGDVNNFKIFNRHEYYAWDYQKNLKYKIINWEDLFANDQMRLFETYQRDPTWNQPGNNVYVVVSPSYQRLYNVKVGDAISLGDDQTRSLYVGAIGGDVGNIYPTIYDTDTIPNQQTEAIIYLNPVAYSQTLTKYFIGDSIKENSTAFLQSYGVDKQTDLKNFKYYLNDDFLHLNQNNYAQIKSNQETAAITNRNTMLGTVINIYQLINYGLMIFFYAILVLSLVFIMKKIINKRRVENGILKANGFSIYQIAASYLSYGIIISLIGGLAGWGLGLVMQIPIMNVFNKFFILPVNFTISGWSFLYNIIIALGLTIFIILLMGIIQLKDNPLKLIQPNSNLSSENKLTHLLKRIHFKKFTSRFKVILLSVSLKNIGLLFIVLLLATVGLTGAIIIPTSLKQVSQDYYKNLGYNNETNYNGIIGNNPLTGYQLYNWTGPDSANPTYPIRNNNVFPNYIKEYLYDKDGNTLDENGNIVPIGSAKKYWLDIWNLPPAAIKYYEDDLRNAVLYNFATARGTALSLGIFKALSDHYLDDDLNYTISTLLCTVVPTAFGKEPIPFDNTKPYESWRYCFSVATESILPPDIKQIWSGNEQRQREFAFTFGTQAYQATQDDLFTRYRSQFNDFSVDTYGISADNNTIVMKNKLRNDLFNNDRNSLPSTIPVAVNSIAQKKYGWQPNDQITTTVEVPTLQFYNSRTKNYQTIGSENNSSSSYWFYNASGDFHNTSNLIDLEKENLDLSKLTINNDNNSFPVQFGYQADNKIRPYYQLSNIELLIPTSEVDASDWDMNLISDTTGVSLPKLFETNPPNPQQKVVDKVNYDDGNGLKEYYVIKPYNTDYDYIINDPLSSFQTFPNNWYHVAMSSDILHTTNPFLKVNNVRKEVHYQVVGVQESYDRPRIFLDQTYANQIMGYNLVNDQQTNTKAWFNGQYSKDYEPYTQTTVYNVVSPNGDFLLSNFFAGKFTNAVNSNLSDYIGIKKDIIIKLANISIILSTLFVCLMIIAAVIVVFIITEAFLTTYLKFIAVLKTMGYRKREINSMTLGIFTPFVFIAWVIGVFGTWFIIKAIVMTSLNAANIVIPLNLPWILIPITFVLIGIIYGIAYGILIQKINHSSIQEQINLIES